MRSSHGFKVRLQWHSCIQSRTVQRVPEPAADDVADVVTTALSISWRSDKRPCSISASATASAWQEAKKGGRQGGGELVALTQHSGLPPATKGYADDLQCRYMMRLNRSNWIHAMFPTRPEVDADPSPLPWRISIPAHLPTSSYNFDPHRQ